MSLCTLPPTPQKQELATTHSYLKTTVEVADSMADAYDKKLKYDLMSGAYVFALLGLESCVKQLVHDALKAVIENNAQAHQKFIDYIVSLLRGPGTRQDATRVARAIAFAEPGIRVREQLEGELVKLNHRSKDGILKAAAHFGIPDAEISSDLEHLQTVLHTRKLLDEDDRAKSDPTMQRPTLPGAEEMRRYSEYVFETTVAFYKAVEKRLEGMQRRTWN